MIIGTILILLAWFVEMPLWLSVVATVGAAVHMVGVLAKILYYEN